MPSLGQGELVVVAFVVLVVFSASRMGQVGNALGRFVYSLRRGPKEPAAGKPEREDPAAPRP